MRRRLSKRLLFYITSGFIIVMMVSLFMLASFLSMYRESARTYDALSQHLTFALHGVGGQVSDVMNNLPTGEPLAEPIEEPGEPEETFALPEGVLLPQVDFDALAEINPHIVAWILLEGTPINYPVVQGADNYHYLMHLFDGTRNASGTIFVDSYNRPGFVDQNTVIYGHNMWDGSMFSALERYRSQEFFEENPWLFFLTPERNYVIKLFAGYETTVTGTSWRLGFADDTDLQEWLDMRRESSAFVSEVEVDPSHRFVTLSTCSGTSPSGRFVVIGRLIPIA